MILTDTGPLVALLDRGDPNHATCRATVHTLPREPLLTTWPSFTEAMHLLGRAGGHPRQADLWRLHLSGRLVLEGLTAADTERTASLMAQYHDTPMDLADASLVALAERLGHRRVFSLDSDFHVYRLADGDAFEVIPA